MSLRIKILTVFCIFLLFMGCSKKEELKESEIIRPVKYIKVFTASNDLSRKFSGVSKAAKVYKLSFRVGGKVLKIYVDEGDLVKKGQLIADLDNSDAKLKYEKALASLNRSKVSKDTALSNLERIKTLYENDNVSLTEYESAKDNYANANATWLADKRNTELQQKELGYYSLYSPAAGIVSDKSVEEGENISPGQLVLEVHLSGELEVRAGIPETYIAEVKKGSIVNIEFNSIKDKIFQGEITEVSYNVDKESSTYPVSIRIQHPTKDIRPGMPADVIISFNRENAKDSLYVSVHAVGEDNSGNFVYIVKPGENGFGTVEKRSVVVGDMTDSGFEIKSGLKDEELVVTAGISKLSDGLKVRMQ